MKRILLILVLFACSSICAYAQDCQLCGDWHGSYYGYYNDERNQDHLSYGNIKVIVRILRNGDSYSVRKKAIYPDGDVLYDDNHTIDYNPQKPNAIGWYTLYDTEYEKGMKNGDYYEKINYFDVNRVTLDGNQLQYEFWNEWVYLAARHFINEYDVQETFYDNIWSEKYSKKEIILYKDDSDW